ncbi:MAG TPA: GreA/GreB family elongation factor [Rhodothermales bacterium]
MNQRSIYVTDYDMYRLRRLLDSSTRLEGRDTADLRELKRVLDQADIVSSQRIPPDCVTMNARFRLRDLTTGDESEFILVFPDMANLARGRISVVSRVGAALLGRRELDVVEWEAPAGKKRFLLIEVLYQPEAAEEFHV